MEKIIDLIVLGAGSGGLAAAKRAASYGANVAVIEGDRVGGTCVIRGCVPKKLLVYGSLFRENLDIASSYGVHIEKISTDTGVLLANVRNEVERLSTMHIDLLKKSGVELIKGWGSFSGRNEILVSSKSQPDFQKKLSAKRILVAVGGTPNRLDIPGAKLAWVSDDMFLQKSFPKDFVVIGGGFIACEFACILHGLGVNVTQLVRREYLLNGFDKEISNSLRDSMERKGINLLFNETPNEIKGKIGDLNLITSSGLELLCGGVLLAIGRTPLLKELQLHNAGIYYENNSIPVDLNSMTNISNIFAIGDVTNRINLTPVAIAEGRAFSDRIFGGKKQYVNYEFIPKAVFSDPEIATVGLTEEMANKKFGPENIYIYRSKFRPMSQSMTVKSDKCIMKLIVESNTEKIIGCHMIGDTSAEIIQMASIAISMGAKKSDFDNTMALHPTISEEFVTMP